MSDAIDNAIRAMRADAERDREASRERSERYERRAKKGHFWMLVMIAVVIVANATWVTINVLDALAR